MRFSLKISVLAATLFIAACTTIPTGPSVMVLPGASKSFSQFRADDMACRNYALESVGGQTASQAATDSGVKSAVIGTAVGAAAGAAIGGQEGAAIGAGSGLLIGGLAGTQAAYASGYDLQHRYDVGYIQCMYALGHQVPVSGRVYRQLQPARSLPPPPPRDIPCFTTTLITPTPSAWTPPTCSSISPTTTAGSPSPAEEVEAPGSEIAARFGARYIITDLEHKGFLRTAQADPALTEVYRDNEAAIFTVTEEIKEGAMPN